MIRLSFIFILMSVSFAYAGTHVQWLTIDGAIGPVSNEMVENAIELAESANAEVLVIELDTPGGLLSTTRMLAKSIMASKVPIVVYISPSGSRAGSAGVFITLAAHVAAMAPGTNIGAAHPVGIGGMGQQDSSGVMEDKVTNDAAAFARTLAERHGRNVEWAENSVRHSVSATENEALSLNIIDFIASSRDSLLILLDGRVVELESGEDTLSTAGLEIHETPMSLRLRILDRIAEPNIAYILLLLGIYGLFFELYNPGSVLPGIVGGVSLILAFFSLQLLPLSWAGLLLILFGIVLFLLEIKITSYGLLSIGGVVSMTLGSLMLFEPIKTGLRVGLDLIIPAAIITALFFAFVVGMGLKAQSRKVQSGAEGLVGKIGTVATTLSPSGKIHVHGEVWDATASESIEIGARVRVLAVSGLSMKVERAS